MIQQNRCQRMSHCMRTDSIVQATTLGHAPAKSVHRALCALADGIYGRWSERLIVRLPPCRTNRFLK